MNAVSPITNITDTADITSALRGAGMLAYVSISTWGGTRADNEVLDEAKRQQGGTAAAKTHNTKRNLMAGRDARLKAANSAFNAIRTYFYQTTLPWVSDPHALRQSGPRLLTYPLFEPYMQQIFTLRRAAVAAKQDFVDHYPTDSVEADAIAKQSLGNLYKPVQYPTKDEVANAFRLFIDIEPIPESASFRGLPDGTLKGLQANLEAKQQRQIEAASKAAWDECRDRVKHLVEQLTATKADGSGVRFHDSTVENVRELLTLLPGWNITGNPYVAEVVKDLEQALAQVDGKSLRKDDGLRHSTAAQAQKVVDKMAGWGL